MSQWRVMIAPLCVLLFIVLIRALDHDQFLNGADLLPKSMEAMQDATLNLTVALAFQKIYFTNTNSRVFPTIVYYSSGTSTHIQLADIYCGGDMFSVQRTNLDTNVTDPTVLLSSTIVGVPSCSNYTLNPNSAFTNSTTWSLFSNIYAGGGNYQLTIVARSSPFSAGAALIRRIT